MGTVIGYVSQDWSCIFPCFSIQDADKDTILKIKGPFCTWAMCGDINFQVLPLAFVNFLFRTSFWKDIWKGLILFTILGVIR